MYIQYSVYNYSGIKAKFEMLEEEKEEREI